MRPFDPATLRGTVVESELQPGVTYRLDRALGEGGMGIAFFAVRDAPDGVSPVVLKVVRPEIVFGAGGTAEKVVKKEVVALTRLNERVPPTPFVVRFIDTGKLSVRGVNLPWIAVEHVHGGIEGTTLERRAKYAMDHTGCAFDPVRATHALRSLGAGLSAIHHVGVIHRDLSPANILCCGFGEFEIFKISDFGLARMASLDTFGSVLLGTPAYSAPEQNFPDTQTVGPHTDVFSLACVAYFLLTGEPYFDAANLPLALLAVKDAARKSVLEGRGLCPELRAEPDACREIDRILSGATAYDPALRPEHAQALTSALGHVLRPLAQTDGARASRRLIESVISLPSPVEVRGWQWTVRHPPEEHLALYSVAWEGDAHCIASATTGLVYWTGSNWTPAPTGDHLSQSRVRCVHRVRAGTWVLGGDGVIAVYSSAGIEELIPCPGLNVSHASGHLEDLLVAVSDRGGAPEVHILSGRRWHAPLAMTELALVSAIAQITPTSWLIAGRRRDGDGGLALCRPLERALDFVVTPKTRALLSTASQPERALGLAVGLGGVAVSVHPGGVTSSALEGEPSLSACAVDILDREWAGGAGRLWVKEPGPTSRWRQVWEDTAFVAPFVSVMADVGMVLAVTANGAVLEGRAPWTTASAPPR